MQIHYYLKPNNKNQNSSSSFQKIIEYLLTFVGDIEIKKVNKEEVLVFYVGTPTTAFLKLEKNGQITVTISTDDNVTINLLKNITQSLGLRIYNPQMNCYLLNDVNIFDLSTIKIDVNVKKILNKYNLVPLFQYHNSFIFFCKANDGSTHLVNRHLLEYLNTNEEGKLFKPEFSVKVADSTPLFIALFDRGLINLNFQENKNGNPQVVNLSGFELKKLQKDIKLQIINFIFDEENQSFIQEGTLNKIPKNYLALKVGQDYSYKVVKGKLTKFLNVSVYN